MAVALRAARHATLDFLRRHSYLFATQVNKETHDLAYGPLEGVHVPDLFEAVEAPDWESGCTEPWIVDVLAALLIANRAEHVIELGGYTGFASKRLARALNTLRRGELFVCEISPPHAERIQAELDVLHLPYVQHTVIADDSHKWLPTLPNEFVDFVWIDGNHAKEHVYHEIELLLPKMRSRGILAFHDVFGICDLAPVIAVFHGFSLDLPRLGPAGGLGLIQVP